MISEISSLQLVCYMRWLHLYCSYSLLSVYSGQMLEHAISLVVLSNSLTILLYFNEINGDGEIVIGRMEAAIIGYDMRVLQEPGST